MAVAAAAALILSLAGPAMAAAEDHDADGDGRISRPEALSAVGLFLDGKADRQEVVEVVRLYLGGGVTAPAARIIGAVEAKNGLRAGTIDPGSVALSRREWGDASLGCPVEGYAYAQVVTAGYHVVVGGGDRWAGTYRVAAGGRGAFRLNAHPNGRSYHEDVDLARVTGSTPSCAPGRPAAP